jgi:hypothetical protein
MQTDGRRNQKIGFAEEREQDFSLNLPEHERPLNDVIVLEEIR